MRAITSATEIASLGCDAATAASAPAAARYSHCVVIDAGAADLDMDVAAVCEKLRRAGQRDQWAAGRAMAGAAAR